MPKPLALALSIAGCELVGVVGSVFTAPAIPTWYASLNKPVFTPPNWVFAPVWITLYFLMGASLFLIWQGGPPTQKRKETVLLFLVQLFFTTLWSFLFFGFRWPAVALVVVAVLLGMIVITVVKFWSFSRIASVLLWPYLAWVCFASVLNAAVVVLN